MKRCPACQRAYPDDTLSYCLEDGSALLSEASGSNDLAATIIIPEPRQTAPVNQDTYRPTPTPPQPFNAPAPLWQPTLGAQTLQAAPARGGKGAALISLIFGITAFVLLGFCIIGGATGVNESLIGGVFLFSLLLALVGSVMGIIATSRSSKDAGAQNTRAMSIIALVLNVIYLLITMIFLILGAVASKSSVSSMRISEQGISKRWYI